MSFPFEVRHITGVSTPVVASVVNALFGTLVTRSTWPRATLAGAWFCVGMEFQISTRFCPRSATKTRMPSEVTDAGLSMLVADAGGVPLVKSPCVWVLKSGCPSTRFAACAFAVGQLLQISTRLFMVSATKRRPFWGSIHTPSGPRSVFAAGIRTLGVPVLGVTVLKSGWPSTLSAFWPFTVGR